MCVCDAVQGGSRDITPVWCDQGRSGPFDQELVHLTTYGSVCSEQWHRHLSRKQVEEGVHSPVRPRDFWLTFHFLLMLWSLICNGY